MTLADYRVRSSILSNLWACLESGPGPAARELTRPAVRGIQLLEREEREGSCQGLVAQQVGMSKGDEAPAVHVDMQKRLTSRQ